MMRPPRDRPLVQRGDRKPLYVQVVTQPVLHGCWSVNISSSGIGLIAAPLDGNEGPHEGEGIEMELALPDSHARIRVRGEVRWRHDAPKPGGGTTAALGVSFRSFEGSDQVRLAQYLADHQLVVGVAYASAEQAPVIRKALEAHVQLRFAPSAAEVEELLARGDLSALVVAGDDGEAALRLVERVASRSAADNPGWAGQPEDLASRIVFCAPAEPSTLLALFNGARIYRSLARPIDPEALHAAVLRAVQEHGMRIEQQRVSLELERNLLRERARAAPLPRQVVEEGPGFGSAPMRRVMELVRVAAPHRVAVLLQGETGTGKEVLARSVHALSGRRDAPFIVQDCGALTETLLESELFGHVKGAFTGAVAEHRGLFVLADSGTIFLDEIENTTANFQAKLLRVLETGDVRPVGGTQVRHVDVRVIAASNRDLMGEVRAGRFRSDLYYRLNTFTITVPPLRERSDDILALAHLFIDTFNRSLEKSATGLTAEARDALLHAPWPGNVRELRNVIERAVLLSQPGQPISPAQLPEELVSQAAKQPARGSLTGSLKDRLEEVEKQLIRDALERSGGVLRRAAAVLKTDPVTLGRKARKHGLWEVGEG